MANPCENVLRVSGEYNGILHFDEKFKGGVDENYQFENLYPVPEFSISEKCEWCKKHWSVKGNFYEESFDKDILREGDTEIYYYFDTPWCGPELLIQHISKEFDNLEFMLVSSEPGNKIRSLKVYYHGEVKFEEELSDSDIEYWFGKEKYA